MSSETTPLLPQKLPGGTRGKADPAPRVIFTAASTTPSAALSPTNAYRSVPAPLYSCSSNSLGDLPIYTNIHRIRRDVVSVVEDYLSVEQLRDVRINITVIRPIVDKLFDLDDISIVYCLLVNRAQFLLEEASHTNRHNVHFTRATLCELIATRILRRFSDHDDGANTPSGLLVLSHVLVAGFEPFQGAPAHVHTQARRLRSTWVAHRTLPALEIAILTESKYFLSSTPCQRVIHAIYEGRITYTPSSFLELIPDHYKQKPIQLYDPRDAPLLNQYRLLVPRTRNALDIAHFIVLLVLYLIVMARTDYHRFGKLEMLFAVYSFGWALDQFSTIMSHGWHVYTQNLWSFLDVGFTAIYVAYLILRIHGLWTGLPGPAQQARDVLALGALVLVPRLAFNLLSDNLVFLSLRSMMADFSVLTALSAWCFFGFLLSLYWLGNGSHLPLTISKWMLWIWFGLDGTGIQRSAEFHWLLGPSVMVAFAFLGNTLFLTILVSMLSNTFGNIAANATAEICYRRAVLTLEGVKSDNLFAYMPPFNIVAVFVFFPLRIVLSPRWFHKIHVAAVRLVNLPLLLAIALAERRMLRPDAVHAGGGAAPGNSDLAAESGSDSSRSQPPSPRRAPRISSHPGDSWWTWFWPQWSSHRGIRAVFDLPPPDEVHDEIAVDDELTRHLIRRQFTRTNTSDFQIKSSPRPVPSTPTTASRSSPATTTGTHPGAPTPSSGRTSTSRKDRRDSMFPGIAPRFRGSFSEDDTTISERLAHLEAAMGRIEAVLSRMVPDEGSMEGLGENGDYDSGAPRATGRGMGDAVGDEAGSGAGTPVDVAGGRGTGPGGGGGGGGGRESEGLANEDC